MANKLTLKRNCGLDLLRIISALAVVFIHSSGTDSLGVAQLSVVQIYSVCMQWAVPVFVMISGALFLNPEKELNLRTLYLKNIMRLVKLFVFWSALYAVIETARQMQLSSISGIKSLIGEFLTGHFHMWYIIMLIGLYAATPVIKSCLQGGKSIHIYWLVCCFVVVSLTAILSRLPVFGETFEKNTALLNVGLASKYIMYYLLGSYLTQYKPEKKVRTALYCAGIVSWLLTAVGTAAISIYKGELDTCLADNALPNHVLIASSLFVFVNSYFENHTLSERVTGLISAISAGTLGVYLIHPIFAEYIFSAKFTTFAGALAGIPLKALSVFLLSFAVVLPLKRLISKFKRLDFIV